MKHSYADLKVTEFSLRLVIPFSYGEPINEIKRYFTQLTINDLMSESSPFNYLVRQCDEGDDENEQYIKPIKQKNLTELKAQQVWEDSHLFVSEDLYPHIRRILMTESYNQSVNLQMSDSAWHMLNGGYGNPGSGLALTLTKTSKKRLNTDQEVMPISFCKNNNKPSIHLMGFGLGVLVIEVAVGTKFLNKYGVAATKEITHELSRNQTKNNNLTWLVKERQNFCITQLSDKTNFKTIIDQCLGVFKNQNKSPLELTEDSRFFSFSAIRIDGKRTGTTESHTNDLLNLANSLAQRHTSHYLASNTQVHNHTFMPYKNIVHGMSNEGGSVIIDTTSDSSNQNQQTETVQHLVGFINDVFKKAYWPMLLLSYIEFRYLIYLTTCISNDYKTNNVDTLNELELYREKILNFRLNYRFSQASQISNHNQYYKKWRDVFNNDRLSDELSDDITQINSFLNYQADRHDQIVKEKQDKVFTYFGVFATTLLSVVGLFGTNFVEFNNPHVSILSWFTLKVLLLGIVIAVVMVWGYKTIRDYFEKNK